MIDNVQIVRYDNSIKRKGAFAMEKATTTNISIRMDKDLKKEAEKLFGNFGLNLSTAFNIFVRQSVMEQRIPFEIAMPKYGALSKKALGAQGLEALRNLQNEADKNGRSEMTMDEIIEEIRATRRLFGHPQSF
jgi:addiction module RelB/DinJ family antitoxin